MTKTIEIDTRQLPANFGPLKDAPAHARVTGPCGDTMEFWLRIEDNRIAQATFTSDGCGPSIASGAMAAALIEGKTLAAAEQFTPDQVLCALGGLPADHVHCPILAVKTLQAALADYRVRHAPQDGAHAKSACATPPAAVPESEPSPIQPRGEQGRLPPEDQALQDRVGRIAFTLVVLSGKGGVGKSTVAANLAVALAAAGKQVGLLDVDVHGPSIPKLLGLEERKPGSQGNEIEPILFNARLKVMSIGFLLGSDRDAVIWRGPMKYNVIRQLLSDVAWGDLEVLVVDSPPGTGDEPLAVAQLVGRPAAAIVVTTPQQLAVADARRSITFCQQVGLPVLGLIENMSGYVCPKCGETTAVFKTGGGADLAREMNVPFLGSLPIDPQIVEAGDSGTPWVDRFAESPSARAFAELLKPLLKSLPPETKNETIAEKITMKIAISLAGGRLAEHFGHCEQFALVEVDPNTQQILNTTQVTPPPHEPGLLPRWLREQGVQVIIAGGIGQRALTIFAQNGIEVRAGYAAAPVEQLVVSLLQGQLTETPQGCAHHEHEDHHPDKTW